MRLILHLVFIAFVGFIIIGCATTENESKISTKEKVYKDNTIELKGWGTITFSDKLYYEDKNANGLYWEADGLYWKDGGSHFIAISRKAASIEKTLIHESLHAHGWNHRTKKEKKAFEKKMAEYGSLKEEYREAKSSKKTKGKLKIKTQFTNGNLIPLHRNEVFYIIST